MDDYKVIFNSNNLGEVEGVWLYYYNATDLPDRDINIHKLARRSLSIVTSAEYTQKNNPCNDEGVFRWATSDRRDHYSH